MGKPVLSENQVQAARVELPGHWGGTSSIPGDVTGTIRDDMQYRFVPNNFRRHRLVSIRYISLLLRLGSDATRCANQYR